jgi:murein DD-endopeptidase MepM/ murein hydrolase activator NlpD
MRNNVTKRFSSRLLSRGLLTIAAASMLAGCSNSIERFSAAYNNPSDSDPVYTASVPKKVAAPPIKRKVFNAPEPDIIEESPVARAPLAQPKPKYNYEQSYAAAKPYKPAKPKFNAPVPEPSYDDAAAVAEPVQEQVADVAPVVKKRVPFAKARAGSVQVEQGMTLNSIARANNVDPMELAAYNKMKAPYHVWLGQTVRIPEAQVGQETIADVAPKKPASVDGDMKTADAPVPFKKKKPALSLAEEEVQQADSEAAIGEEPAQSANLKPKAKVEPEAVVEEKVAEVTQSGGMNMRWPLKGKVISGFGPKSNGLKNEGINIAVPEGTSIRAADGGTVAYAGNELKGYGNLVLIRHTGGYVTAYAHAKELMVKRGDAVKRGDVIAKAGQTGAVSSPQLHFEVRKGATALDPMKHLSSATAMN